MARAFYATFDGQTQRRFNGDDIQGMSACLTFRYETVQPAAAESGMPSAGLQPEQLTIVKAWNASSPQIYKAMQTKEYLTVFLGWESVLPSGYGVMWYYHLTLTNALVTRISSSSDAPEPGTPGDTRDVEEITLTFQKIDIWARVDVAAGTSPTTQQARVASTPMAGVIPAATLVPGPAPTPAPTASPSYSRIKVGGIQQASSERNRVTP